jgi:transcriptional regulator with XRE-family HTH domain
MDCYDRIKELCDKNGIAVTALETQLGFGRGSIGKMRTAKSVSADRVKKIADYFGVPIDYLVNGKETLYEIAVHKVRQEKFVDMFNSLSPKDQDRIMLIMESFLNSDEYKEKEMQTS